MEEVTHCDYDYDTDCENKFAFAPNKFFTPPVLQQSTFIDIFSDVDLQMLLVALICTIPTQRIAFYARWLG